MFTEAVSDTLILKTITHYIIARAQASTWENVGQFFDLLKPELEKIEYHPNCIFSATR